MEINYESTVTLIWSNDDLAFQGSGHYGGSNVSNRYPNDEYQCQDVFWAPAIV